MHCCGITVASAEVQRTANGLQMKAWNRVGCLSAKSQGRGEQLRPGKAKLHLWLPQLPSHSISQPINPDVGVRESLQPAFGQLYPQSGSLFWGYTMNEEIPQ